MSASRSLHFLLLEDRPLDAELMARELRLAGLQFSDKRVATEADFLAQLREAPPDLILADYSLPSYDGLRALASAQEHCPETPFIFVSGALGEEEAIQALQRGATDYVLKQRWSRLGPAVKRALNDGEQRRQRAHHERHIHQLNLLLRAIRDINKLIVRESEPAKLLSEACKILVQTRGYALAWIGLAEPSSKRVIPAARAGDRADYLDSVQMTWDDAPTGQGPTGTAMRTGQAWVCQDIATDAHYAPWRDSALARGYASAAAVPMIQSKRVVGAVMVYSDRKAAFHDEELELLKELAQDLAFALTSLEHEKERRNAEEALRNSEQRARILFEFAPDAYFLHSLQGVLADGNKAAEALTGYRREELIGKSFLEANLLAPDGCSLAAKLLARNAQGEATGPDEFVIRRKDGTEVTAEVQTYPVRLRDEVLVLGIARDITQRKNAEKALAESRGLRKALMDNIPDPAWLKDLQGRFLACNEPLARFYGLDLKDIIGRTVFEILPDAAERLSREDQEVIATAKPVRTEQPFTDGQGQRRWFEIIKSPILNERGEVASIVGIARETTERWQTDEALRVSEERFRSVWEHSLDGMRLTDRQGRIIAVNAAFCRLVKLPPERLIGQVFSVAFSGEGPNQDIEAYQQCFEAGTILPRVSTSLRLWNSEELEVEISSSFVESGSQSKSLLSLFRDIADRKRAEARVAAFSNLGRRLSAARSAREAGQIIVAAADQLLGWDACNFALYSSSDNLVHHVLSQETVDGARTECWPPYSNHAAPTPLAKRVIEEGGQLINKRHPQQIDPDGSAASGRPGPATVLFVPARSGAEVVALLSIQSYTPDAYDQRGLETLQLLADHCAGSIKRISAQEALAASESNHRSLVECAPDAILLHRDGAFVYVNPAGLKLLGAQTPEQVLGRSPLDTVPPENRELIRRRFQRAAEGETNPFLEQTIVRLDGTTLPVEATSIPFTYEGKPAVQTVMRDITERSRLEQQLRQSQKMQAIGQLAGGVAHDFNNMLAVIRGNAELLLMDPTRHSPETRECLKQVTAASERAANLTRQLLAFSRKQVMQSQPLLLNDVIADLTKMLKRIIGEHIDLQCRYAAQLPAVQADAGMIEQVLLNLAVNARDAMPRGGRLLITTEVVTFDAEQARTLPEAGVGEFVCLAVSDSGTGIPPEHLPRIFEPFFTTKELGKGTGLGLATVYGIVKQHQGFIDVSSQPGEGATFKIYLPAIPTPAKASTVLETEPTVAGGTETILLVEDDFGVRMITRRVLEGRGYKVYEATTAAEALEIWQSYADEIELLLSDIVMPRGLTGRDLAEQLRLSKPALRVILMSGYGAEVVSQDTTFFRRTQSSFLQKPCSARVLLETVRRCLDGK